MRLSEFGYAANTFHTGGKIQRLGERIAEIRKGSRRASPFRRELNELRIQSLKLIIAALNGMWHQRGIDVISFSAYDALAAKAQMWFEAAADLAQQRYKGRALAKKLAAKNQELAGAHAREAAARLLVGLPEQIAEGKKVIEESRRVLGSSKNRKH